MSEIALAKINSFAPVAQQADVSPSEPIFALTGSQLQEIIKQAIQEATSPFSRIFKISARKYSTSRMQRQG